MEHSDEVTGRAFFTGVREGDLDLVRRYFDQRDVRIDVDEMNALVRTGSGDPWFEGAMHGDFVFATIVRRGYVELLEWFFSQALFTDVLPALTTRIALTVLEESSVVPAAREMLEIVLSSSIFTSVMNDQERRNALAELLSSAAARGRNEWLGPLLAYGADATEAYAYVTPLFAATERGDAETIRLLVTNGAIVTQSDLVTQSVWESNVPAVQELLRLGADTRSATTDHNAALLLAAEYHLIEIVKLLVQDGVVDIEARDRYGRTPLLVVAATNRVHGDNTSTAIVTFLLDSGADLHATDDDGSSVLHWVAYTDDIQLLRLLLVRGCNPNVTDASGCTPLRELSERSVNGAVMIMLDVLLQCGADPFIPCHAGHSAVDMLERIPTGREYASRRQQFLRRS
jgi:ankyrin repeat protein